MSLQKLQNNLKQGWLKIKNATMSALVVTLLASIIIGMVALIPVVLAVILAIILIIAFRFVYEQYSRNKNINKSSFDTKKN